MKTTTSRLLSRAFSSGSLLSLGFILLFGLVGCGGGGGGATASPHPKGFYDSGTTLVRDSTDTIVLNIPDLQGMVSGNRFMLISVAEVLLYDGSITDITDDTFTADVNIYRDGVLIPGAEGTATVAGTYTSSSSMTGILTGFGAGNGSFTLTYSTNNSASALARVAKEWRGPLNGATGEGLNTIISSIGVLSRESGLPLSRPTRYGEW